MDIVVGLEECYGDGDGGIWERMGLVVLGRNFRRGKYL